jgi:large subunit ribosomal protein L35
MWAIVSSPLHFILAIFIVDPSFHPARFVYNPGLPNCSKRGPRAWFRPRESIAMPKQKTHKGTKKRFRVTANGKVKHRSAGTSHLASRMSKKRRRKLRGTRVMADESAKKVIAALGGNSY